MESKTISAYRGKHLGDRAWIFGKGPSLDSFDMDQAGPLRVCINESVRRVPSPAYFFAHDERPIARVASDWPKDCVAVLETGRAEFAASRGIPLPALVVYCKQQLSSTEAIQEIFASAGSDTLIGMSGTVHSAIHFCKIIGVSHVSMIGFDGKGDYAPSLNLEMPIGGGQHGRIRRDSERLLQALELSYDFGDQ